MVLYELVTGVLPFETRGLTARRLPRPIRAGRHRHADAEPPGRRPGGGHGGARRGSSGTRHRSAFAATLRGDLDWIVLKAIERDRARRYETASGAGLRHRAPSREQAGGRAAAHARLHRRQVHPAAPARASPWRRPPAWRWLVMLGRHRARAEPGGARERARRRRSARSCRTCCSRPIHGRVGRARPPWPRRSRPASNG